MIRILIVIFTLLSLLAAWVWLSYRRDIAASYARIENVSSSIATPFGNLEYLTAEKKQLDVLMIHGAGGGFDQGELLAQEILGEEFNWIAPSRFGYLKSDIRQGATVEEQAHTYAYLLDSLNVDQVAVVGVSAGGVSAYLFALLYPQRVTSLTLISCGAAQLPPEQVEEAENVGRILTYVVQNDFVYWAVSNLFKRQLLNFLGADRQVIETLSPHQYDAIERVIDYMNPASVRYDGIMFDHHTQQLGKRIAAISHPTLIIHAQDDVLFPYEHAQFAAQTVPNARLLSFERGGHFVATVENITVREEVRVHIISGFEQ
ncbi:alpha/beta hydrolase [Chitinispirillales bacterium ANBcel5]|uniref:alpha/beta fold hydrolase n=1 Tax=Cellulosispirillum alkaliphilum TaxID=3039283 RepID=UPI002A52D4A7|nr:alpha/beta hydrolase [Chitinispirillales bacterium ANBcel5]